MVFSEVLSHAKSLSPTDQIRLIEALVAEKKSSEEDLAPDLLQAKSYPIWSPYNSYEAAKIMLAELAKNESES